MSKKFSVIILLVLCLTLQSVGVNAESLRYDDERIRLGKVVEVIDGEVIKVFFFRDYFAQASVETVKLIGIDTDTSVDAFNYTSNRLLGSTVYFIIEDNDFYEPSSMIHANVFYDFDKTVSEELLELGFAKVDESYKGSEHYHSFLSAEYNAQLYEEGRWATTLSKTTDRININTATSFQLADVLDLDSSIASKIVSYRLNNPFNNITEIMAVDPLFNAEWFDSHNHLISVMTNMNKASYLELTSLIGNGSNAQSIIDALDYYARFNEIKSLDDLKNIHYFSSYYLNVTPYMTLSSTNQYEGVAKYSVNVNTCSSSSFEAATKLDATAYKKLTEIKKDDYLISTIGELYTGAGIFSVYSRSNYNDHLNAYTDVNRADQFELMSLFDQTKMDTIAKRAIADKIIAGRPYRVIEQVALTIGSTDYSSIKPYIYVYEADILEAYNVNTVAKESLEKLDEAYSGRKTRYTNINRVGEEALLDLYPGMTSQLVEAIVDYRSKHDFWYKDDLKDIFVKQGQLSIYNKIQSYIVFE